VKGYLNMKIRIPRQLYAVMLSIFVIALSLTFSGEIQSASAATIGCSTSSQITICWGFNSQTGDPEDITGSTDNTTGVQVTGDYYLSGDGQQAGLAGYINPGDDTGWGLVTEEMTSNPTWPIELVQGDLYCLEFDGSSGRLFVNPPCETWPFATKV
jgi:hypothetical protein